MITQYKGTIVEESLEDNRILNDITIVGVRISRDENPSDRWHLYTVNVSHHDIDTLSKYIKAGKWYMHFWNGNDVIAVYKDRIFEFNYDAKETWKEALEYGRSLEIPEDQLTFEAE